MNPDPTFPRSERSRTRDAGPPDLTVILSTFDRADELRRTLQGFCDHLPVSLSVEIVVVDNNSGDETPEVIETFAALGPVRHLSESRPGKNCALNHALDTVELGEIVIFTDDDVDVGPGYFDRVWSFCREHPDHSVFGGKIVSVWPTDPPPAWATDPSIIGWGFPVLDLGSEVCEFPENRFPVGPNMWVRRDVFADGLRYDESFGPRPTRRIMASETSLLKTLLERGHPALYAPDVVVGHRVLPAELRPQAIRRRAFRNGRTSPNLWGLRHRELLARSRFLWRWSRRASLARYAVVTALSFLHPNPDRRTVHTVRGVRGIAYNLEALHVEARDHAAGGGGTNGGGPAGDDATGDGAPGREATETTPSPSRAE